MRACPTCITLIRSEPVEGVTERLDSSCPSCACEHGCVGSLPDAARVDDSEALYSVIVVPPDMEEGQLVYAILTQAERQGLSVLRGAARDEEFVSVARQRIQSGASRGQVRAVHGVAELKCGEIRALRADPSSLGRQDQARLFCIYDTDSPDLPHHADIFQTWPRGLSKNRSAASRKQDRLRLLELYKTNIITAAVFRGGILKQI